MTTLSKYGGQFENSTGLQSDPAGNVIKLSNKHFTKDVCKNLNSIATIEKFNKIIR